MSATTGDAIDDEARYLRFRGRLVADDPVEIKSGPGGLSFYVAVAGRRRFACHFNARPRRAESGRGFADFKPAETGLDADGVVSELERLLADRAECRRGAAWWSAHFVASEDEAVASAFRAAVLGPLLAAGRPSGG